MDDAFVLWGHVFDANTTGISQKGVGFSSKLQFLFSKLIDFIIFNFRYGIHLAQALTLRVKSRGYTPFVVIRPENDASRNLYTKLGFVRAFTTVRVTLSPNKIQSKANGDVIAGNDNILYENNENGHGAPNGNANDDDDDAQQDEGIEDMRNETVDNISVLSNDDRDEGIDEEDGKED